MSLKTKYKLLKRKIKIIANRPSEKKGSQSIDISNIKTLCMVLGPYRNLTTLTASIMSLHPNCQVLNHGLDRIKGDKDLDFLLNYSKTTLENFLRYAIFISGGGKRGDYGGSITLSHAFAENNKMRKSYKEMYGNKLIKNDIQCLLWKESLHTTNILQKHPQKFQKILNESPNIKFILPIRNTLDCAESNINTGMATIYPEITDTKDKKKIIKRILEDYLWIFNLKQQYPDRFFYFFQHEVNKKTFTELATYANIIPDPKWLEYSIKNYNIRKKYEHPDSLKNIYKSTVLQMFKKFPSEKQELLRFIGEN